MVASLHKLDQQVPHFGQVLEHLHASSARVSEADGGIDSLVLFQHSGGGLWHSQLHQQPLCHKVSEQLHRVKQDLVMGSTGERKVKPQVGFQCARRLRNTCSEVSHRCAYFVKLFQCRALGSQGRDFRLH